MKKRLAIIFFLCAVIVLFGYSMDARAEECDHSWYETEIQPATLSQDGTVTYECWDCDETYTEQISRPVKFALSCVNYTYDDEPKYPDITVWDAQGNEISDSEYYVDYEDHYSVGTGKVYVEFDGYKYSGTKTLSFNINPRSIGIKKLSAQPKGFQVKWNWREEEEASGYQIQYSQNASFSNSKTVTIKSYWTELKRIVKLKAKTRYYVRMRVYKTVDGKNYYSAWGKSKSVVSKSTKNKKKYCHNLMKKYRGFWLTGCEIINEYPTYYECKATVLTGKNHWTPYKGPKKKTTVRIKKNAKVNYEMWRNGRWRTKKVSLAYYLKHYGGGSIRIDKKCKHNSKGYIISFRDCEAG